MSTMSSRTILNRNASGPRSFRFVRRALPLQVQLLLQIQWTLFLLLLLLAILQPANCQTEESRGEIPSLPLPVSHTYLPQDRPVFESWAKERGLIHRATPIPEEYLNPSESTFAWHPIPDKPDGAVENLRTTLRARMRNIKKEKAPPGRWVSEYGEIYAG